MPHRFLEHFLRRNGGDASNSNRNNGLTFPNPISLETSNNSNDDNNNSNTTTTTTTQSAFIDTRRRTSRYLGNLFNRLSNARQPTLTESSLEQDLLVTRLVGLLPGAAWLQCHRCTALIRDPVVVFHPDEQLSTHTRKERRRLRREAAAEQPDPTLRHDGWEIIDYLERAELCYQEEDVGNGQGFQVSPGLLRPYCRSCIAVTPNASTSATATATTSASTAATMDDQPQVTWLGRVIDVTLLRILDSVRTMALELGRAIDDQDNETDETTLAAIAECYRPRLLDDLQCDICRNLLYHPIVTPCGHTFCRSCLERAHDHSQICPSCRQSLPSPVVLFTQGKHHLVTALTKLWFPRELDERKDMALKDEPSGHFINYNFHVHGALIPIFVCALVFPGMPCYLHIFEPHYRLLIRRCWMGSRRFGMVCSWPPTPEGQAPPSDRPLYREYGTMLWIERVRFLPDGRLVVLTRAERYFRVMRIEPQLDGYNMASVMWVDDSDIPQRFSLISPQEREHDEIGLTNTIPDSESSRRDSTSDGSGDDMVVDTTPSLPSHHSEERNSNNNSNGDDDDDNDNADDHDNMSCSDHHSNRAHSTTNTATANDSVAVSLGASLLAAAATVSNHDHPNPTTTTITTATTTTATATTHTTPLSATAVVVSNTANVDIMTRNAAASLYHSHRLLDPNLVALSQLIYTRMMYYRQQATHVQRQQIDNVYGSMPNNDAQALSFWAASVVPIDKHIRYNALIVGSVRNRLILISQWLDALDRMHQNWWRSSACTVM